jgi:hypothetical protein
MDYRIIFVKTRYVYPSYTDMRKLTSLSGFDMCYVDEMDFTQPVVYILAPLNGEYRPHRDNWRDRPHNAHVIWWCLERPTNLRGFVAECKGLLDDWYFDEIWLSDRYLVDQIVCDSRVKFTVLGSHYSLGGVGPPIQEREYDVIHLSCSSGRRDTIWLTMERHGLVVAENAWGIERHQLLNNTKFMVNVHQDNFAIIEPLRFALCAAYGLPMLTEHCVDAYPYTRGGDHHYIEQSPYNDIVNVALDFIKHDNTNPIEIYEAMGTRMREMMCGTFGFGPQVREAVARIPEQGRRLGLE